jgi:chromosome segregation ATPase
MAGNIPPLSGLNGIGEDGFNGSGIAFDTASGISEEEQREILAGLEAVAGRKGIETPPAFLKTEAKKWGGLFPLLVNIGAVILLAAGFLGLYFFHNQTNAEIRKTSAALGITEKKLIQEIRRETARRLSEKEGEINGIMEKLALVDAEYQALQAESEEYSEASRQHLENLLLLREEYNSALVVLNAERTRILEEARIREANLHAQLEQQVGELSAAVEQGRTALGSAREELSRLSDERQRGSLIEGQIGGYYRTVNQQIREGRLDAAVNTLKLMEEFINTPSFQGIHSLQSRRELYRGAAAALELTINEIRRLETESTSASAVNADADTAASAAEYEEALRTLEEQNAALEQQIRDQDRTIAAFTSQGSDLSRRITEYENTITTLRGDNTAREQQLAEQDNTITALKSQVLDLTRTAAEQETSIGELQDRNSALTQTNEELRRNIDAVRQLLQQ